MYGWVKHFYYNTTVCWYYAQPHLCQKSHLKHGCHPGRWRPFCLFQVFVCFKSSQLIWIKIYSEFMVSVSKFQKCMKIKICHIFMILITSVNEFWRMASIFNLFFTWKILYFYLLQFITESNVSHIYTDKKANTDCI